VEGAVQAAAPGEGFVFGEVAVGIEFRCFEGSIGPSILEFFKVDDFAGEASEDVKEAGVFQRVLSKFFFDGGRREVGEDFEALSGDNLEGGLWQ